MSQPLGSMVAEVAELLKQSQTRIVFAESCTGGLVAATLARVPGISEFLCGSAVVYRLDTKTRWLGVSAELLIDPGPVSEPVARAMASGVLLRTPEASLAVAITGHLGPKAPAHQDGQIFVAVARRDAPIANEATVIVIEDRLPANIPSHSVTSGDSVREQRQWLAVERVLSCVRAALTGEI